MADRKKTAATTSSGRPQTNASSSKSVPVEALVARRLGDMCNYLGIGENESHLFWIAEMALVAKLPPYWKEYKDKEGHAYYHNHASGATSWSHPRDGYFQELVDRERAKIKEITKFADQQRRLKWDDEGKPEGDVVEISNKNTTVLNVSNSSYPTLRCSNKMALGKHVIGFRIDSLQQDGYIMIGIGKENVAYNTDAIPPDDYNNHGYTTVGEVYSAGRLLETGKEKMREGDIVAMVVDFSTRAITWFRNDHPVGFIEGFEGTGLFPMIVMGYKGYQMSIVPLEFPPHSIMKWDPNGKKDLVELEKRDFVAKSNCPTGYATVRTSSFFDRGKPYFEMEIDVMARDGFLLIGIGNADVYKSETQIPSEEFNHYGYASTGEAYAHGLRVRKGLPRLQKGDVVGLQIIFEEQRVVFYLNDKPILELPDVAAYEQYYPTVTFGNAGYTVRIHPTPYIPLGVPKWTEDEQTPQRFTIHEDNLVVRCLKANAISVVVSDVEYVASTQYFEVVIEAIHPEAEMCIGLAFPSVKDSLRLLPEEKHNHFGYCNNGDLVAFGKVYQTGAPLIRIPDRIGVMIDFSSETVTFFSNGFPVGRHSSNYVRGKFRPVITCVGPFEAHIVPTPAPPSLIPEWDPLRMQEVIELSRDALTAATVIDTQSARTVWSATTYQQGTLYFELEVDLHGRSGYTVFGVGNRNFAGDKGQKRANLPFEEYFVVGYTSRGEIIMQGAVEREGEEPYGNSDVVGMRIDFARETFCAYKNGHPVIVGNCTGTAVGVSPMATFVYGPHSLRLNPMPHVPPPPHRWDPELCNKHVKLSNYDTHAKNLVQTGYPTVVTSSVIRFGRSYIELYIDYLPESGFLMLGVAGGPVHECLERVPPHQYHHWGYASIGEIWAQGVKEMGGREDIMTGDTVGMMVDMDAGTLMFYKNGYPIGYYVGVEGGGVTRGVRMCVTFGYTNYSVTIRPTAKLPDGSPRWDMVCKSKDIRLTRDHLTCTNTTYLNAPTVRATSGFTEGRVFFEVSINYIKLGGYIAVGLGGHDIHENTAVYPPEHYQYIAYTTQGELLMNGEIVETGLPRCVTGDDVGIQADYESGLVVFYKNRHPVGELTGLEGELYPAVIFTNENYSVTIHANAKSRLEVPPFMRDNLNKSLELGYYDFRCSNTTEEGFPTIRTTGKYRTGSFFFEITIDKLGEAGHMCFGLGSLNIHQNNEYLPSEKYSSYAYSSAGELYALGEVASEGHMHFVEGQVVGFMCDLDKSYVTFYINNIQVGELRNLAPHMEYSPFVVFGNGKYQATISRVPTIAKLYAVAETHSSEFTESRDEARQYLPYG